MGTSLKKTLRLIKAIPIIAGLGLLFLVLFWLSEVGIGKNNDITKFSGSSESKVVRSDFIYFPSYEDEGYTFKKITASDHVEVLWIVSSNTELGRKGDFELRRDLTRVIFYQESGVIYYCYGKGKNDDIEETFPELVWVNQSNFVNPNHACVENKDYTNIVRIPLLNRETTAGQGIYYPLKSRKIEPYSRFSICNH